MKTFLHTGWYGLVALAVILAPGVATAMNRPSLPPPLQGEEPGPEIKLVIEGLGNGYSSPGVTDQHIYVTGEQDSLGYITAFDWTGREVWKNCYGPEWTFSYRGSRAQPTVDHSRVYICSGEGDLICYQAETGIKLWQVNLIRDLGGQNVIYGYSMPVLVEGDRLFCAPGGEEHNIVALDKYSGELLWTSPGVGESAGYGKPLVIRRGEIKILMTFSEFTFLGLNADTGELLWTYDLNFKGELPCNQPVYNQGRIYIVAGPGNGTHAFDLSPDGRSISKRWDNLQLNSFFGGFVLQDNYLVGAAEAMNSFVAVDAATGNIKSRLRFGRGATTRGDKHLISYNQRGQIGILQVNEGQLSLLQEFRVSRGSGEHFAMPVFYKNMLLIRHGNTLLGYQVNESGITL